IIAFITNYQEVKKILKHIGEQTQRAPPLPSISPSNPNDYYEDYFPPDEVYFADEQWVS
ncbi:MAG: hypothetical protein HQM14_19385, partial [SAR324 cluster bacterium]|nr:hypothetical protein [SAR324 cluster bacterium]